MQKSAEFESKGLSRREVSADELDTGFFRQVLHDMLLRRLGEKRRFLQVLAGPRQTGKITLARQVMAALGMPPHYASADEPTLRDRTWLEQQWDIARLKARDGKAGALLVLDEIQKVTGWPNWVKLLWDQDTHAGLPLKVALLGSSPLLVQSRRRKETLAGMEAFAKQFRPKRKLLVGGEGIPLAEFLARPAAYWLE